MKSFKQKAKEPVVEDLEHLDAQIEKELNNPQFKSNTDSILLKNKFDFDKYPIKFDLDFGIQSLDKDFQTKIASVLEKNLKKETALFFLITSIGEQLSKNGYDEIGYERDAISSLVSSILEVELLENILNAVQISPGGKEGILQRFLDSKFGVTQQQKVTEALKEKETKNFTKNLLATLTEIQNTLAKANRIQEHAKKKPNA